MITQILCKLDIQEKSKKYQDKFFSSYLITSFTDIFIMSSSTAIGCINGSRNNSSLSFLQIASNKRKEIRQEWFRIKRGQNEKYLSNDLTL